MSSNVVFKNKWLPIALITPQLLITFIFFIWPAGQAIFQSFQLEDPFGFSREFVGLENFIYLFNDSNYIDALFTTLQFSISVAFLAMVSALLLSAFAEHIVRGSTFYRTFLIWPYAVAPVVAGSLWLFLFDPTIGIIAELLGKLGVDWDPILNGSHAMWMVIIASTWKQISYNFLFFFSCLTICSKVFT